MTIYRRLFLLLISILALIFLFARTDSTVTSSRIWRSTKEKIGLDGEDVQARRPGLSEDVLSFRPAQEQAPLIQEPSPFSQGTPKPPGSTYTKAVIMGRLRTENTTWLDTADLPAGIEKYIYNTDTVFTPSSDPSESSLLKLPKTKGHEAMVYLTYIISQYETLPDVSIFMHAHQLAWHNDEMLNHDAVEMIRRLSAERVVREGYMNLRCHWKPGCPEYIHPHTEYVDEEKLEEGAMKAAWLIMFPDEEVPEVLAAPCCAQFAVSRERIRGIPLQRFETFRQWLLDTEVEDYVSGRVFEYLWHRIFTGQSTVCPDMRVCYCDGYGVCFEDEEEFDHWFEVRWLKRQAEKKLGEWKTLVEELRGMSKKERATFGKKWGIPASDGDIVVQKEINGCTAKLEDMRLKALQAGTDPRIRARIAGRTYETGDGY